MTMKDPQDNLLIIFTRNPELGKCKTRLAASVGNETALAIYIFLLKHTQTVTTPLKVDKEVHYSDRIGEDDLWDPEAYKKKMQWGEELGARMYHAIKAGFEAGYKRIILIGSDLYDLSTQDLEEAFDALHTHEVVLGPAEDGGYYLLGTTHLIPEIFKNKAWGTGSVLADTLANLTEKNTHLLETKNDVDVLEDIKDTPVFQQFLNKQ
ncbi:MAG: glycosyltransferase [Arenibacter sp.]|nr:glycosyltransferase [Arenibacter sp.]